MCGIAGYVGAFGAELLPKMNAAQVHRGPDDQGVWTADRVGLAHVRLAILDLSSAGHQPMADATGRVTLVFNGEIYNYRELRDELEGKGERFGTEHLLNILLGTTTDAIQRPSMSPSWSTMTDNGATSVFNSPSSSRNAGLVGRPRSAWRRVNVS